MPRAATPFLFAMAALLFAGSARALKCRSPERVGGPASARICVPSPSSPALGPGNKCAPGRQPVPNKGNHLMECVASAAAPPSTVGRIASLAACPAPERSVKVARGAPYCAPGLRKGCGPGRQLSVDPGSQVKKCVEFRCSPPERLTDDHRTQPHYCIPGSGNRCADGHHLGTMASAFSIPAVCLPGAH